jgi:hypothetical protein
MVGYVTFSFPFFLLGGEYIKAPQKGLSTLFAKVIHMVLVYSFDRLVEACVPSHY